MNNLGDKIAAIAQPIARTIDYFAGTDFQHCPGCKQTQNNLNMGMPVWDAFYERFFGETQQQQKGKQNMIFLVLVAVEAEDARDAIAKIPAELPIRAVNQGPPTPQITQVKTVQAGQPR